MTDVFDSAPSSARNPAEVQVDLLLEAQRSISKRLTSLEGAMDRVLETCTLQGQAVQRSLRVLQAEIEALKQIVLQQPAPRRCLHCLHIVPALVSACPGCGQSL